MKNNNENSIPINTSYKKRYVTKERVNIDTFIATQKAKGKKPNKLINEKSPYLLQHAFNPVEWYPWGEEAFEKARSENKPIFVSIGYSTCHWCHVMARDTFENAEIAATLNNYFVNVKVDKEERPDLDRIYMAATQAMTGKGGWPLSIFLTHDLKPFYTGTFFPSSSQPGQSGFLDILVAIKNIWHKNQGKVAKTAHTVTTYLQDLSKSFVKKEILSDILLERTYQQIEATYDSTHHGFNPYPKFPQPVLFNFLLRYYFKTNEASALDMVLLTLQAMAQGGIYDQIGGGFHRYTLDPEWRIPHFEKMLYDQAQCAAAYLEAYQITRETYYADIARDIFDYVIRDMYCPNGGFCSAEDADSPSPANPHKFSEGSFYLWTQKQIQKAVGVVHEPIVSYYYGVSDSGNRTVDPSDPEYTEGDVLYQAHTIEQTAVEFNKSEDEIRKILHDARESLFTYRLQRPRPHRDDKIITAWNGLMISALTKGYRVLNIQKYLEIATSTALFVITNLYDNHTKTLLRRYRKGHSGIHALLVDYAFLVQGFLDLFEASGDIQWLNYALILTHKQVELFWDDTQGGFFETEAHAKSVLFRMKEGHDGAEPCGNAVQALNLLRLSYLCNIKDFRDKAVQTIQSFGKYMQDNPFLMPQMIVAVDFYFSTIKQIFIFGKPDDERTTAMIRSLNDRFLPNMILIPIFNEKSRQFFEKRIPGFNEKIPIDNKTTAYICENYTCHTPATEINTFVKLITK